MGFKLHTPEKVTPNTPILLVIKDQYRVTRYDYRDFPNELRTKFAAALLEKGESPLEFCEAHAVILIQQNPL